MLGGAVRELVGGERDEVAEHDLCHRLPALERKAGGAADDRRLADRRRVEPVGKAGREPLRHRERAPVGVEQVLAEDADVGVALEQVVEGLVQALDHARLLGRAGPRPRGGRLVERRVDVAEVGELRRARGSPLRRPAPPRAARPRRGRPRSTSAWSRVAASRVTGSRVRSSAISSGERSSSRLLCGPRRTVRMTRKDGCLAAAHRLDERGELALERGRVGAVEPGGVDPERLGAGEHVPRDADRGRRRLGDRVVLEHDQQAHAPERGQVHRLVERALAERPVADEDDRDPVLAAELLRERDPERDRHQLALDARADEPGRMQVLAAAASAADAARAAHQLGEERGEVAAGSEEVAVAAVGAEDGVSRAEPAEEPDRDRLLADRGVRRPREQPLGVELEELLLGAADDQHPPVELEIVQHRAAQGTRRPYGPKERVCQLARPRSACRSSGSACGRSRPSDSSSGRSCGRSAARWRDRRRRETARACSRCAQARPASRRSTSHGRPRSRRRRRSRRSRS